MYASNGCEGNDGRESDVIMLLWARRGHALDEGLLGLVSSIKCIIFLKKSM